MFNSSNKVTWILRFQISREEIESRSHKRALRWLNNLIHDRDTAWANRNALAVEVSGYDADPRELWEIPEVCRFFRKLHREWRYWFFFASHEVPALVVLELCIASGQQVAPGKQVVSGMNSQKYFEECVVAMEQLFTRFGFPDAENERIGAGIAAYYEQRMPADSIVH